MNPKLTERLQSILEGVSDVETARRLRDLIDELEAPPDHAPFRWIVAFDVAPKWVADGFVIDNHTATLMIASMLPSANVDDELNATVIAAPPDVELEEIAMGGRRP